MIIPQFPIIHLQPKKAGTSRLLTDVHFRLLEDTA